VIEDPVYKECGIGIRGGDGVIFGNTLRGFRNPLLLILESGTPEGRKASYPADDQIRDLWIWDNEIQGGSSAPQIDQEAKGFVEEGRDYFRQARVRAPSVSPPARRRGSFRHRGSLALAGPRTPPWCSPDLCGRLFLGHLLLFPQSQPIPVGIRKTGSKGTALRGFASDHRST
jgi:hypothetical protein